MRTRRLKAVDLFCGAGGTSSGAEATGEVDVTQIGNSVSPPNAMALTQALLSV